MRSQEIVIDGESLVVLSHNLEDGGIYPKGCYKKADANNFHAKDTVKIQKKADEKGREDGRKYLSSTDWYFARLTETGEAVPIEVLTLRANARLLQNA